MRVKFAFYILSLLFFLNIIGCHVITEYLSKRSSKIKTSYGRDEISCKPASAVSVSATMNGNIKIAWDNTSDDKLEGYKIYYGFSPREYMNCVDIGSPTESSAGVIKYTLIGLKRGGKYYIAVVAYDKNHNKSAFSSEVSAVAE
jgi:hypothetical protein